MAGPIFPPGGYLNPYLGQDRVQTTDDETQYFIASTRELAQTQNGNHMSWTDRAQGTLTQLGESYVIQEVTPVVPPVEEEEPLPETIEGLAQHIADDEPHPAYDDQPSLVLWFENRVT